MRRNILKIKKDFLKFYFLRGPDYSATPQTPPNFKPRDRRIRTESNERYQGQLCEAEHEEQPEQTARDMGFQAAELRENFNIDQEHEYQLLLEGREREKRVSMFTTLLYSGTASTKESSPRMNSTANVDQQYILKNDSQRSKVTFNCCVVLMINSDFFFEEADSSFKEFQSLRANRRKESQSGIIGPWNIPKRSSSPRKQDKQESLFQLSKRKRSLNKPITTSSANEERSMVITRRLKTHVIEFIDQEKFLKRRHFEQSPKEFTLHSFQIKEIFPQRLSQSLKHPAEPTYISQFKYKQHRIKAKKASFDMSQPEEKKERRFNMIPSLDRDLLEGRKGKILSLGSKKMFNQRLHSETSELQRKQMQKMFKSHLF